MNTITAKKKYYKAICISPIENILKYFKIYKVMIKTSNTIKRHPEYFVKIKKGNRHCRTYNNDGYESVSEGYVKFTSPEQFKNTLKIIGDWK